MEDITDELLRKAELQRLDAETARQKAETHKYELEAQELAKRINNRWFFGRFFIQSIVSGVVAAGLVASWFVEDLPIILGTEAEVQRIENELLSKKIDQRSVELSEQNVILQKRVEAQQIQLIDAKQELNDALNQSEEAKAKAVELSEQLKIFAEQINQLEKQQATAAEKTQITELANIAQAASKNVNSQIEQLQTQQSAAQTSLDSLTLQKQQLDNFRYIVGFYSYKVSNKNHDDVANYFVGEGYTVRNSTILSNRTNWLAGRSTVLYYADESKSKAKQIADNLGKITKSKFNVKRGAGLGVSTGDEKWTFFIHYIGT